MTDNLLQFADSYESLESIPVEVNDIGENGYVVKKSNFDNDIKAAELMHYFKVKSTDVDRMDKLKDIYAWVCDNRLPSLVDTVREIERKVGNPVGKEKLNKIWYNLAVKNNK